MVVSSRGVSLSEIMALRGWNWVLAAWMSLILAQRSEEGMARLWLLPVLLLPSVLRIPFLPTAILFWETVDVYLVHSTNEMHLPTESLYLSAGLISPTIIHELDAMSEDCHFTHTKTPTWDARSASHKACPRPMTEAVEALQLGRLVSNAWAAAVTATDSRAASLPPTLSLMPNTDDSRWSVLVYNKGNGVSTHVDSSSYYGNRIAGLLVLQNSAKATSFVGQTPFVPKAGDVIVFEGHRTPHNVTALSETGGTRRVINFLLTNNEPARYRYSIPIRLNRMLVNAVYYSTWSSTWDWMLMH